MEPVVTAQVGCTLLFVTAGADGGASMVTSVAEEIQPALFFTVTLYLPGATLVNTPVVLV